MIRIDTNIKERKNFTAVAVSVASGNRQGISREIRVNSEAELKQVLDYFNRELETLLTRIVMDFADRKESGV